MATAKFKETSPYVKPKPSPPAEDYLYAKWEINSVSLRFSNTWLTEIFSIYIPNIVRYIYIKWIILSNFYFRLSRPEILNLFLRDVFETCFNILLLREISFLDI